MNEEYENLEAIADDLLGESDATPNETQASYISTLTVEELLSIDLIDSVLVSGATERELLLGRLRVRARELKSLTAFNRAVEARQREIAEVRRGNSQNLSRFPEGVQQLNIGEWTADQGGVRRYRPAARNELVEEYASPVAICPTEIMTNAHTGTKKLQLSHYKNGWHNVVCSRSTAASCTRIIELADYGVEVNSENAKLLVKYIADCVALNVDKIPETSSVSHLGWHEGQFIPYSSDTRCDGEGEFRQLHDALTCVGDFEEWRAYMRELRKNIYFRLVMAVSFASPLLSIINALPFVLHLWGGTSAGKTVSLMAAMSVWGDPSMGKLVRTMNMTINAMMNTASFLRDLPFAADELQTIKSRYENYDKLIMSVCEGVERGRMTFSTVNETKSWNCAFIFSGEEALTQSTSGGGAKNRVIEIECKHKVIENGPETVDFVRRNYGHAGKRYIEWLSQRDDREIKQLYSTISKALLETDTTDKQALSMAAIMLGDACGSAAIFPGEPALTLDDVRCFLKNESEVNTAERAYEMLCDEIAIHDERFRADANGDTRGDIWGRIEPDGTCFVNNTQLSRMLRTNGFEFDAVKAKWAEKGYLLKNSQGRYVHQTKCHGAVGNYIVIKLPDFVPESQKEQESLT